MKAEDIPLNRYLASCGLGPRRYCDNLIREGRVYVNGDAAVPGMRIHTGKDSVTVDDKSVFPPPEYIYILLNKPKGYLVSDFDPEGRHLAKDLLPDFKMRLFPVGRLDYQTEGAILYTNDGVWANKIAHPRHEIPKTYLAKVRGIPSKAVLDMWIRGIRTEGRLLKALSVRIEKRTAKNVWLRITLSGGVNRQIRRMGLATGHPVVKLVRISIGSVSVEKIPPGSFRHLTPSEIRRLADPQQPSKTRSTKRKSVKFHKNRT
ncbi:rRNA pseudouridine synthase [bacterium]|nr:rRNA pseudouridine synthase [candidate division CSSED10-310 bacterium]